MRVNSLVAAPIANAIRVAALAEGQGVCGLLVPSINLITNLGVPSHLLLAHIIKVHVTSVPSTLTIHPVTLNAGSVTLKKIFKNLRGVKYSDSSELSEPIFQATGPVKFSVITGRCSLQTPLTESILYQFAEQYAPDGLTLIPVALPFLSKEPVSFRITDTGDGTSEITFNRIADSEARDILGKIIL